MTDADREICARCRHFTLQGTTPEAREKGQGRCIGFNEFLDDPQNWNDKACKLYRDAKDMPRREAYIRLRGEQHAGTENAVDETPGA